MRGTVRDLGAIALIGDGVVGLLVPARHARRYERGPRPWRRAMSFFARRPGVTRGAAVAEVAAGVVLATRWP